jgi:DNA-binding transcriptional MerR regulator
VANLLTIGVFSDASHLSIKMLRRYHESGLLVPALVDPRSGHRAYAVSQLADAEIIRRLRLLDVPLDEVARVLEERDAATTAAVLAAHTLRMQDRLMETERIVGELQRLLDEPGALHRVIVHARHQDREPTLAIRRRLPMADCPAFFGDAFPRLLGHAAERGAMVAGPVGGRFGDGEGIDHDDLVIEAFVPVDAPVRGGGDIVADHLPETELAVALHVGPYTAMTPTYGAVGVWVAEHDRRVTGPLQELYLLGPGAGVEPRSYRTEVGWPVTAGA